MRRAPGASQARHGRGGRRRSECNAWAEHVEQMAALHRGDDYVTRSGHGEMISRRRAGANDRYPTNSATMPPIRRAIAPPGRFDPADPAHRYRVTRIRRRARLTHQRSVRRPCRLGPRDACWHNRPSLRRQRVGGLGRRLPSRSAPPPSPGPVPLCAWKWEPRTAGGRRFCDRSAYSRPGCCSSSQAVATARSVNGLSSAGCHACVLGRSQRAVAKAWTGRSRLA